MFKQSTLIWAVCGVLLVGCISSVVGQPIQSNLFPKAGDLCKDLGPQWKNMTLGPCEAGTQCKWFKRGVWKCVNKLLKNGDICWDARLKKYQDYIKYRQADCADGFGCMWVGGSTPYIYKCQPLPSKGCYTMCGSAQWPPYGGNQSYIITGKDSKGKNVAHKFPGEPCGGPYPACPPGCF